MARISASSFSSTATDPVAHLASASPAHHPLALDHGCHVPGFRRMDDFMSRSTPPQPHLTELMDPDGNVSMCQNAAHLDTTRRHERWGGTNRGAQIDPSSRASGSKPRTAKPTFASPRRKPNRPQGSWEAWFWPSC
ncbi:hypothetical protein MRS44_010662 [Fusarium solani]|uniref:uncharacterized protein n=1 Tax=Fusarium solani TaxID=169388 RepID=UPI0032C3FBDB|nr:hypothetical protein MRS44_010662 [Fusarium solani]